MVKTKIYKLCMIKIAESKLSRLCNFGFLTSDASLFLLLCVFAGQLYVMIRTCLNLGGIFLAKTILMAKWDFRAESRSLRAGWLMLNCSVGVFSTASLVKKLKSSAEDFLLSFDLSVVPSLNPNPICVTGRGQERCYQSVCFGVRREFHNLKYSQLVLAKSVIFSA